jgi:cellulose biosynthesis protein BcsQ
VWIAGSYPQIAGLGRQQAAVRRWLNSVIGVMGGSGGVGASSFAAALTSVAENAVLVDLDPVGGGIDVLLGIDDVAGARWSGLRVDGGYLDPALLAGGLPRWRGVAVLAADQAPDPGAVPQVLEAAGALGTVVLDLPRTPSPLREAGLAACDLCVVVAAATDVRTLVAAGSVLRSLPDLPVGIVLRRGGFSTDEARELLGAPLLGVLPSVDRSSQRASLRVAAGVLDGLAAAA